jgi:hypothetical protein
MEAERAQLSSVATGLDELIERVDAAASRVREAHRDDLASDLYEVERSLEAARRRLAGVLRQLR